VNREVKDRLFLPIVIPLAAVLALAFVILAFSRILLAVPQEAATPIALAMALNILTGAALFASLPRLRSWVLKGVLVVGALILAAGAIASMAVSGELEDLLKREEKPAAKEQLGEQAGGGGGGGQKAGGGQVVSAGGTIVAKGIAFNATELKLPAEQETTITFDNQDAGIPHDVAIYTQQGGESLFTGEIITGPAKAEYAIPALEAGSYYFQCNVHPNMNGTVTVA
jgi:plastocyanin